MNSQTINITLTLEEAQELASLLSRKTGMIGWQAMTPVFNGKPVTEERRAALDESFKFWSGIAKKVTTAFGYQAWMQPSVYAEEERDREVEAAVDALAEMPTTVDAKARPCAV